MKYILISILAIAMSCEDNDKKEGENTLVGKWQLAEVVGSWNNKTTPAEELDYKEYYEFNADSSMRKYRSTGEEAKGTYSIKTLSDGDYVEVIYDDPNNSLKETCGEHEFLRIIEGQLKGGSLPCDGPGLNYVKVKGEKD